MLEHDVTKEERARPTLLRTYTKSGSTSNCQLQLFQPFVIRAPSTFTQFRQPGVLGAITRDLST